MPTNDLSNASRTVHDRTILFGECDPAGVMYTPRIVECLVEGALKFVSDCLGQPFERFVFAQQLTLPARNIDVDFLQPVTWDDEIQIRAGVHEIRTHAYTIQVAAFDKSDAAVFAAKITQVCVDTSTKSVAKLPEQLRQALLDSA